ncbi:MAG: phosphonatase-like hydrolase [Caldilineaceae bacterium]
MKPQIDLAVLDMAGTTIQDRGEVPAAFDAAMATRGIQITPAQLANVRGAAKRTAIRTLLAEKMGADDPTLDKQTAETYAAFGEFLRASFATNGVALIPGVEQALRDLRQRGIKIALNTGFDREMAAAILTYLPLDRGAIDAVVCGDDVSMGRPAPYMIFRAMEKTGVISVHNVMTVGDTALDLAAGHNAGAALNVGVLSGAHPLERLKTAPHTHIVESAADLAWVLEDD